MTIHADHAHADHAHADHAYADHAHADLAEPTATDDATPVPTDAPLVEEESLVEEISIDGMCGVY